MPLGTSCSSSSKWAQAILVVLIGICEITPHHQYSGIWTLSALNKEGYAVSLYVQRWQDLQNILGSEIERDG